MFINSNLNLNFQLQFLLNNKHHKAFTHEHKSFQQEQQSMNDPKYKTELCKKFSDTGTCPYGSKCRFAHGKGELISKMLNSNYKKKPCKTFNENGFCPYGSRCSFKHSERSLKEIKLPFYYVNVHIKNIIEPTHKRLTIFESISNSNNIHKNNDLFQNNCIHSSSTSTSTISNEESGDEEVNEKKKKILNCCENALNANDNNNIN